MNNIFYFNTTNNGNGNNIPQQNSLSNNGNNIPQQNSLSNHIWLSTILGVETQEVISSVANSSLTTLELDLKDWIFHGGPPELQMNRGYAASIIRQAFINGAPDINLPNYGLIILPNSIELCAAQILKLSLSNNQFSSFPPLLQKFVNLQDLDLSNNQLRVIPTEIESLKNLKILLLNGNQLRHLPNSIGSLVQLQTLNLSNNQLESLPESIGLLVALQELNLNQNILQGLPESISELVQLKRLHVEKNQLFKLPQNIGSLLNLRELTLDNNNLTSLPETFSSLINLRELKLSKNLFELFPLVACRLSNLIELYISDNKLQSLPQEIAYLVNVTSLYLNNNQLHSLPESIGRCTNLSTLSLTSNPNLSSLPMTLTNCIQLMYIFAYETGIPINQSTTIVNQVKAARMQQRARLPLKLELWKNYAQVDYDLSFLCNELKFHLIQQGFIAEWLNRLEYCQDFRHKRVQLAKLICNILSVMNPSHSRYSKDFNEAIFAKIEGNLECCDDRASMLLNMIYTDFVMYIMDPNASDKSRLKDLVGIAKTITLRDSIAKIIDEYQKANPGNILNESVEIYLYYESHLKDALGLITAINNMHYRDLGRAPNIIDVNTLIKTVEDNYHKALAEISAVDLVLEKNTAYVSAKRILEDEMAEEMEKIEPKNGEPEQIYIDSANALVVKKNTAMANLKKEFTLKILEN